MIYVPTLELEADEGDDIHVYPMHGRDHTLNGLTCWCRPTRDSGEPLLVIHHLDLQDQLNGVE